MALDTQPQLDLPLPGVALAAGEEPRRITLGDRIVPYLLRRGARRTIGLSIDHRGLRVGAPRRTSLSEVEALIHRHGDWVVAKLDEWRTRRRPEILQIKDGLRIPFLGGELDIRLAVGANKAIWGTGTLTLCMKPGVAPGWCWKRHCVRAHVNISTRECRCLPVFLVLHRRRSRYRRRAPAGAVAAAAAAFASTGG